MALIIHPRTEAIHQLNARGDASLCGLIVGYGPRRAMWFGDRIAEGSPEWCTCTACRDLVASDEFRRRWKAGQSFTERTLCDTQD